MKRSLGSFDCRLCWRITFVVFGLILGVELAILVPSAWHFKQREHQQLVQRAQTLIEPALARAQRLGGNVRSELLALVGRYELRGVSVYADSGELITRVGSPPGLETIPDPGKTDVPPRVAVEGDGETLVASWHSEHPTRPLVIARINAAEVGERLRAYLLRIAELVAIILFVVTVGTMLVLDVSVLRPLLSLRDSAIKARNATDQAASFTLSTDRRDEIGELIAAHNSLLTQVTESHRRNQEMARKHARFLTRHDPGSGLPNQGALEEFLDQHLKAGSSIMLFRVNVLHFRTFDATYGTGTGEHVTRGVVHRLQDTVAPEDLIAHTGPGQFAVARVGQHTPLDAETFAEKLLRDAQHRVRSASGETLPIDLRAGIALSNGTQSTGAKLASQAEMALARTYRERHCRYGFYSSRLAKRARRRQIFVQELEQALDHEELFVVLQPKIELLGPRAGALAGAEALLRWQHPQRGLVSPSAFIPVAEFAGMMEFINDFVLRSVAQCISGWSERYGSSPRIAINISAQELARPDFEEQVKTALALHNVSARLLECEITETTIMKDSRRTVEALCALREMGVRISVDDFGTGYSSLSYLRQLPLDAVKIDRTFVRDIGKDDDAEAICTAILRLGQTLGMRVVAEGVETREQLAFLREGKCDEAQGYLFSKPVSMGEFERDWLDADLEHTRNESRVAHN